MNPLPLGAYEQLITELLEQRLAVSDVHHQLRDLDPAEAALRLTQHLAGPIQRYLESEGKKASRNAAKKASKKEGLQVQIELANRLLASLNDTTEQRLTGPRVLLGVHAPLLPGQTPPVLPDVPLLDHDLLANAPGEPSFVHSLLTELPSADRVDAIVAFIRWSGLNLLRDAFRELRARDVPVRILTTTYIGATERRALDWLDAQGVEVKVSYDTRTTRLHAKAWVLHRESGFSTAFIGSSNLSKSALVSGMEWNLRLAEKSAPDVVGKLRGTFTSLWAEGSVFERYDRARDAERFDRAVRAEKSQERATVLSGLEVKPWAYQREMLEALVVERQRFKRLRNLVVAPTGTGKTVVAALDFAALRAGEGGVSLPPEPKLLFVAHRQRILEQSRAVFRNVLRRGDFGELLVGGQRPATWDAVFASIQTLSSGAIELPPDRFDVVYIDEFHHAEARTYRALLGHLKPKVLVGLTATPERTDGTNVNHFFGDRYAFEMRLWDALDQQLLAPFHYFGISDGTDLSRLQWARGGYRERDLEAAYIVDGYDARSAKVIAALRDTVADAGAMRALGFCVSVKHAHYMARRFTDAGLKAEAMDGSTPADERRRQLDDLEAGRLQVVFAVDVLTEGVDLPSVDTLLLLRPTESATVFLQQLGRGLRLHRGKDVCTVLDFIGQQHKRFRFDLRLRAMTGRSRAEIESDVQQGFPYLPSGCHLRLDRQAAEYILNNLRESIGAGKRALVRELRLLHQQRGELSLHQFLEHAALELDDLYRRCSWTDLRQAAGLPSLAGGPREAELLKGVVKLREVDDTERLDVLFDLGTGGFEPGRDARADRLAAMLAFVLFKDGEAPLTLPGVVAALQQEPAVRRELAELAVALSERTDHLTQPSSLPPDVPLHLHGHYRRAEVLVALGERTLGGKASHQKGVEWVEDRNIDAFFVTLEKSEKHYSPSTRYRDYAISRELFHWESQSRTTRRSPTGKRYLAGSSTVLLFVRKSNKQGNYTPGFVFLGPATLVDDRGEEPIAITWKLKTPMPERWFRLAKAVAG